MAAREHGTQALTAAAFERLLEALDADRDRAGERYELLRRKLLYLFGCRGLTQVEDLADETLSRVAARIGRGEFVQRAGLRVWGRAAGGAGGHALATRATRRLR
jgi:hypothetical protein